MIISLAVIIISILYLLIHLKKLFKSSLNECEFTMRELTENSLKEFIKEIRRHEEQYHSSLYKNPAHAALGRLDGESPYVKGSSADIKWKAEYNKEPVKKSYVRTAEQKKKAADALRKYHADRKYKKSAEYEDLKERKRLSVKKYRDRKKQEAQALRRAPLEQFEPYKAFVRPGDVTIQ